jgi:hypothetical protein
VAGDLSGDDTERNLSVRRCPCHIGKGAVARCPRGARWRASAPYLCRHARMPAGLRRA